jgi:hypothetical protein
MWRLFTALGILAVVGFLGTQQGQAQSWPQVQSDVGGMDNSKPNHGVLGHVTDQVSDERQQTSSNEQASASDPDVIGMDHSKLNHGVLGTVRTAAEIPPPSSWAPPAEIAAKVLAETAGKAPLAERRSAAEAHLIWQPPAEIARPKPEETAALVRY